MDANAIDLNSITNNSQCIHHKQLSPSPSFNYGICCTHLCNQGSCFIYSAGLLILGVGGTLGYVITNSMLEAYRNSEFRLMSAYGLVEVLPVIITGIGVAIIGRKVHLAIQRGWDHEDPANLEARDSFLP